jgi:hypothetical protein
MMTLYEETGYCPLQLFLDYRLNRNCINCPFENGVDIGVGWLQHCDHECVGGLDSEEVEL